MSRLSQIENEKNQEKEEKEKAKKNHNFIMVFRDNMPELRWLMNKSGFASSLLFFILEHMDHRNALACSYSVFEDYFGVSKDTIRRALKLLRENGFIDVLKMGTSNVYLINTEIAWSSWDNQKQYAQFDGKMLVSKKENKDYEYRTQFDKFKALREREGIK